MQCPELYKLGNRSIDLAEIVDLVPLDSDRIRVTYRDGSIEELVGTTAQDVWYSLRKESRMNAIDHLFRGRPTFFDLARKAKEEQRREPEPPDGECPWCGKTYRLSELNVFHTSDGTPIRLHACGWSVDNEEEALIAKADLRRRGYAID